VVAWDHGDRTEISLPPSWIKSSYPLLSLTTSDVGFSGGSAG